MCLKLTVVNLGLACIGGLVFASLRAHAQVRPMPVHMILPHGRLTKGSIKMNQRLMKPMKSVMTGNTDKDFSLMTAEYLNREIEMSKLEIRYGHNRKLRKIARFLVEAQTRQRKRLVAIGKSISP